MWRVKPSKPAALLAAVVGVAMIVFALVSFHGAIGIRIAWCVVVVGIVGVQLWAAFSARGSLYTAQRRPDRR